MSLQNNILATERFVEEQLLENKSDWNQSDSSKKNYIKNRTHYDDTESGGELKTLDEKYIPTTVPRALIAKVGQMVIVKSVDENGKPIEWETVDGQNSQNQLTLFDKVNGYEYLVFMENGNLVSAMKTTSIKVSSLPDKTDYTDTEEFDPSGVVILSIAQDGTEKEITDYTYDKYVTTGSDIHTIRYIEAGIEYTVEVPITTRTLEMALIDFEYTVNEDRTYTITSWKGTLNGEPSTKMHIPNSELINITIEG